MGQTPVEAERYIRFQLEHLTARNEHHTFEEICYRIAKRRLSSNLLPATGPVSAGGDQGRDAETYHTELSGQSAGVFDSGAASQPLVMACSVQKGKLEAKVRADVDAICGRGEPVETVAFFTVQDVPVAVRHRMQDAARREHGVTLQVFDGQAISHMLAEDDLRWVAERFLALPVEPAPEPSHPALPGVLARMRLHGYRGRALTAGIVALAVALSIGWSSLAAHGDGKAALASRVDNGPALSVFTDIDPSATYDYALTTPVTSAADQVTLESGTASDAEVTALIARHGGVAVSQLNATIVLQSRRASLQVVDIQPRILVAEKAPAAAFVAYPKQGVVPVLPVTISLDTAFPAFMSGSSPYFRHHQIQLARGESETFGASFMATTGYYEFDLVITYITAGKQVRQVIGGPGGRPFRLAAQAADYRAYGTVYAGMAGNQFEVAGKPQLCALFPASRGCG